MFGNDYEAVNFTIQAYLHQQPGISCKDLLGVVEALRNAITQALGRAALDPDDTRGAREWRTLCGDLDALKPATALFAIQNDAHPYLKTLRTYLHTDPRRVLAFVRSYVLPGITKTTTRMAQNPHDLRAIFGTVTGFTGTPWNRRTYPQGLRTTLSPNTDQITKRIFLDSSRTHAVPVDTTELTNILDTVGKTRPLAKMRAFIDCGALLRGYDSQTVAQKLRDYFGAHPEAGVKAVLYFDTHDDALTVWPLPTGEPQQLGGSDRASLARAGFRGEQVFAYFDQAHAMGADLPLGPDAIGIVTVGEVTLLRDLQQGALRLRELTTGQRCDVVYPKALTEHIAAGPTSTGIGMPAILAFVAANQGGFLATDKVQAISQRVRRELLDVVDANCAERPAGERAEFFACVQPLIVQLTENDLYHLFGETTRMRTDVVLRHVSHSLKVFLTQCVQALRDAGDDAADVLEAAQDKLSWEHWTQTHISHMGALPTHQLRRSIAETTVGQEVQREIATEQQQVHEEAPAEIGHIAGPPQIAFTTQSLKALNLPITLDPNLFVTCDFMRTRASTTHDILTPFQPPLVYVWVRDACAGPEFIALSFAEAKKCILREADSPLLTEGVPMALCNHHGHVITQGLTRLPRAALSADASKRAFALLKAVHQARSKNLPLNAEETALLTAWRDENLAERAAREKFLLGIIRTAD